MRRRRDALDAELLEAATERDRALAALGEAALSCGAELVGPNCVRIEAYRGTLAALEGDRAALDKRREVQAQTLDATRAQVRAEDERLGSEVQEAAERVGALEAAPAAADLVEAARRHLSAIRDTRATAREAARREVAAVGEAVEGLDRRLAELGDRRRAALVDLGREALRASDPPEALGATRARAAATLEAMRALRVEREALLMDRAELDETPLIRTSAALIGVLLVLLVIVILR